MTHVDVYNFDESCKNLRWQSQMFSVGTQPNLN